MLGDELRRVEAAKVAAGTLAGTAALARLKREWMAFSLAVDYEGIERELQADALEEKVALSAEIEFEALESQLEADVRLEDFMRAEAGVNATLMSSELAALDGSDAALCW